METFSALLAICAGNSPVPGEFPAQRPVTRSFDGFFELKRHPHLNKPLCKQSWGWWFETVLRPLWRHCNGNLHIKNSVRWNKLNSVWWNDHKETSLAHEYCKFNARVNLLEKFTYKWPLVGHFAISAPGGRLNKKDGLTRYGNSHVKDKTS